MAIQYTLADCLKIGLTNLSLNELKELEWNISNFLYKVRYGIIDDDSINGYEPKELEDLLSSKLLKVQNHKTALLIRS